MAYGYSTTNSVYFRKKYNGVWSPWVRLINEEGGDITGTLKIIGSAANNQFQTRGIQGVTNDGTALDALYLNIGNTNPVYINGANETWHAGNQPVAEAPTGSTLVKRNASGYIFSVFYHSTATVTADPASHYWVERASDGYLRPKTLADVRNEVVTESSARNALSQNVTIADDNVAVVTPTKTFGILFIYILTGNGSTSVPSVLNYRCASTNPLMTAISKGSLVDIGTGTLSGTTGTDGRVTVKSHTDGKIYIENRTGAIMYAGVAFLGV
jgi:hypothetical protein